MIWPHPAAQVPLDTVQVRDETGLLAARVAWRRWDDEVNIALLEITEPGPGPGSITGRCDRDPSG